MSEPKAMEKATALKERGVYVYFKYDDWLDVVITARGVRLFEGQHCSPKDLRDVADIYEYLIKEEEDDE